MRGYAFAGSGGWLRREFVVLRIASARAAPGIAIQDALFNYGLRMFSCRRLIVKITNLTSLDRLERIGL